MKNFFKAAIVTIALTMTAVAANAQQQGDMAVGANLGFATTDGYNNLGLGAKFQYNVTDPLRLEANLIYFFPSKSAGVKTNVWDLMFNAQWLFRVADDVNLYPVAGLGVLGARAKVDGTDAKVNDSEFAFNLGAGADFFVAHRTFVNVEVKYMFAGDGYFMPSAGVGFMF